MLAHLGHIHDHAGGIPHGVVEEPPVEEDGGDADGGDHGAGFAAITHQRAAQLDLATATTSQASIRTAAQDVSHIETNPKKKKKKRHEKQNKETKRRDQHKERERAKERKKKRETVGRWE